MGKHINYKRAIKVQNNKTFTKRFFWSLLFVAISLQVFFAIQSLGMGSLIPNLEKESEAVLVENRKLQRELVAKTSLTDLEKKAPELGFNNQALPLYIKADEIFAQAFR